MGKGLGILAKLALRIEGAGISGTGIASTVYPTTPTEADGEEVALGGADLVPFLNESIEENRNWDHDETLVGMAATIGSDLVGIMPAGGVEIAAHYAALDSLIAAALGFEKPSTSSSPTYDVKTVLTAAAGITASTWEDAAVVFSPNDIGKFIRVTGGSGQGQVRRVTGGSGNTANITPDWDVTPSPGHPGELGSNEFTHTFECSNGLATELFTDVYSTYPTGGIYTSSDQIVRRLTIGIEKNQTKPWVYRSVMVNSVSLSLQAGAAMTISADFVPFDLDRDSSTNTSSSNWDWDFNSDRSSENERILFSDIDYFRLGEFSTSVSLTSSENLGISGFELNINNNLQSDDQDAISGNYRIEPARGGMREISGSITLPRYEADTLIDWAADGTTLMAELSISGSTLNSNPRNFKIFICSMKFEQKNIPVDGASVIKQTFNFRALVPTGQPSGMPTQTLTSPRSEIMIQTTNTNPFNVFLDQNQEY